MPDGRDVVGVAERRGPMIDLMCSKRNESGEGTYELPVGCMNCGLQAVGKFSRGHEAYHSVECPDCGCRTLSSSYARKTEAAFRPGRRE